MLKGKIYNILSQYFEEYLFGFDQEHFQMSIFSGNVNLTNLIVKPDKITEIFKQNNLPIALRAGLISRLNIKVLK